MTTASNLLEAQQVLVKKLTDDLHTTITKKQIAQFELLKVRAASQDATVVERKVEELIAKEAKQQNALKWEQRKLDKLIQNTRAEKKEALKQKFDKAMNAGKTAKKYVKAGLGVAGALSALSYPVDALKVSNQVNSHTISAEELAVKEEKSKQRKEKHLENVEKVVKEQERQNSDGNKDEIEKLLKERDKDIKKGMVNDGKKVGEATRAADKNLLEKLNKDNLLLTEDKASRSDLQNGIKAELQKKAGDDGRKQYEEKLKEESRKQEAARQAYYQKLNQDYSKKR
jgi:hypothetical protein